MKGEIKASPTTGDFTLSTVLLLLILSHTHKHTMCLIQSSSSFFAKPKRQLYSNILRPQDIVHQPEIKTNNGDLAFSCMGIFI